MLRLIRYIHQNPVRICEERGLNYPFSRYLEYLDEGYLLIDKDFPLSLFDYNINKFTEFMVEEDVEIKELSINDLKPKIDILQKESGFDLENSSSLDEVFEKVSKYYELDIEDIQRRIQKRAIVKARKAIIYLLEKNEEVTKKELARTLNISQSSVSVVLSDNKTRGNMMGDLEKILNL